MAESYEWSPLTEADNPECMTAAEWRALPAVERRERLDDARAKLREAVERFRDGRCRSFPNGPTNDR